MPSSLEFSPGSSPGPLSVGNVLNASVRLYHSHFKQYLGISLQGLLWLIIPIFGWAMAATKSAQISRLAFRELINRPESGHEAAQHLSPRCWEIWVAGILNGLILGGINAAISMGSFALFLPLSFLIAVVPDVVAGPVMSLLSLVLQLATFAIVFWVQARFLLYDVSLGAEDPSPGIVEALGRSWRLTQGHSGRVLLVLSIAYLITAPLFALGLIPVGIAIVAMVSRYGAILNGTSSEAALTIGLFILGLVVTALAVAAIAGVLIGPFWQAMKAVIYYDLRARQEGFDLQLRGRG